MALWEVGVGKTYSTIQAPLDAIFALYGANVDFTETETVRVYDGVYTENVTTNASIKPTPTFKLIIEAAVGNHPIVDAENLRDNCFVLQGGCYTLNGFELKNSNSNAIYTFGSAAVNNIVISNLSIHDVPIGIRIEAGAGQDHSLIFGNTIYNIANNYQWGAIISRGTDTQVYNNIMHDVNNGVTFVIDESTGDIYNNLFYAGNTTAIELAGNVGGTVKVYNNIIRDYQRGIDLNTDTTLIYNNLILGGVYGIDFRSGVGSIAYNNTIYTILAIYFDTDSGASYNVTLKNNILYSTANVGTINIAQDASTVGFVSDYNILYAPNSPFIGKFGSTVGNCTALSDWRTATGQESHSVQADPNFINIAGITANDFKFATVSPALNAGVSLAGIVDFDYFGTARPQGAAYDIGLYEALTSAFVFARSHGDDDDDNII